MLIDLDEHQDELLTCEEGMCGTRWYPKECKCGGIIHASFREADYDGIKVVEQCDRCGKGGDVRVE